VSPEVITPIAVAADKPLMTTGAAMPTAEARC
jgi:hypothetical protein